MSFYDFASGFVNTVKGNMDAKADMDHQLEFFKKQEKIREDMRKKAEEAKVTAKRIVQGGNADEGPQPLQVEEYNSQGRVIGTRAASKGEEDEYVQGKQTRAANLAAATSEAEAKVRDEERKDADLESKIKYRDAATGAANRRNLAAPDANTKGRSEADLSKTVVNLMGDPDYMAAVNAGDPTVMRRMGGADPIIDNMKRVATALGVPVPKETQSQVEDALQKESTPEGRAKVWEIFLREMDMAAAKGRASGKGIRPPRVQE